MNKLQMVWIAILVGAGSGAKQATESIDLRVPFHYGRSGMGPNENVLVVDAGKEKSLVSAILLDALQTRNLSLVNADTAPDFILENRSYDTDIAPLSSGVVNAHNANNKSLRSLPTDRDYGIQYRFKYKIRDKQFIFTVSSVLYERGARSPYVRYSSDYSGRFFAKELIGDVQREIVKRTKI